MSEMVEIVVIGNGMFGSAATRHLAERGHEIVNIGAAAEGSDVRASSDTTTPPHRVYSSHNDAARLTRLQDRDATWAAVTRRAVSRYRDLEHASGVDFYRDVGCLIVSRPGGDGISPDPRRVMDDTGVDYSLYEAGDSSWRRTWPQLDFPDTHYVAFEPSPAGYIRPKHLIEAQNVLATRAGAAFVVDTVTSVAHTAGRFRVATAGGQAFEASKVVVGAGAFTNFNDLYPQSLDLRLKSEVVVLGEVSENDAAALADAPTVKYLPDGGDLEGIYMTPPVRYDDGRHYIKMGANTRLDQEMDQLSQIHDWFSTDTDTDYIPLLEPALRALWPEVDFITTRTRPCVVTYSSTRHPVIEDLGDGLFVATAGNGGGAKGSDAWGEDIADLVERS